MKDETEKALDFYANVAEIAQWVATKPENEAEFLTLINKYKEAIRKDTSKPEFLEDGSIMMYWCSMVMQGYLMQKTFVELEGWEPIELE